MLGDATRPIGIADEARRGALGGELGDGQEVGWRNQRLDTSIF